MKTKRITYFVCGGHGTTVCKEAWKQPENKIKIESNLCIGVVDDGGHSGLMRQIYEKMQLPYVPLGDLRNIWADSITNHVISELIQKRVATTDNLGELKNSLVTELNALKSLVLVYGNNKVIVEEYLPESVIKEFITKYINALKTLAKETENRKLYDKHNIGNLFLGVLVYGFTKITGNNGYENLGNLIKELGLFEQNVNVKLLDNKRLDLIVQNSRGETIVKGEGVIDLVEFPVNVKYYAVYNPETKQTPEKNTEIVKLLKNSDLVVIPPGSETNSYPWIKYYAKELKPKKIIRIVNLTAEQSSEGFIEEVAFLENLGLRPFYLYPKTFSDIRHGIGEEQYFKLITKYSQQNKRPQDLSKETILQGLKLMHPEVFDKVSETELGMRIMDIVEVQAYTSNGESYQELVAYIEDDPYISKKGFRHSTEQIKEIIHGMV